MSTQLIDRAVVADSTRSMKHIVNWGPKQPRKHTSVANWRGPVKWNAERARAIAAGENPPKPEVDEE